MVKVIHNIPVRNKSSIDKLYQHKLINDGDCVKFSDGDVLIIGYIVRTKNKVWIEKDDVRYPSIPLFLTKHTWCDYEHDLSWRDKTTINDIPYREIHKDLPIEQRKVYHAKVGYHNSFIDDDGSLTVIWYLQNDGTASFPTDTRICYADARYGEHVPDVHIGILRPREHRFVLATLPASLYNDRKRKYHWKLVSSKVIHGGRLYHLNE